MTVVLDSYGGTVGPGLEIGRAFRRLDMTTTVGKTNFLPGDGEPRATLSPKGICASMCAFALLGGARRYVPTEARVMVHQIWPSAKRDDAASQTYVAENLVSLQRSLGAIARYIVEMGVDIEVFDLSMRVPPWERMRTLTGDEIRRLRVATVDKAFDAAPAAPAPTAKLPPAPEAAPAALPEAAAGWSFTEQNGLRGITHRQQLTVQGNDIGSQYRSAVYVSTEAQRRAVEESRDAYQAALTAAGRGEITTEVRDAAETPFFWAEGYHQQYLAKNPNGYRCHAATGVRFPVTA